jgi:hypothetical protein
VLDVVAVIEGSHASESESQRKEVSVQ